MKRLALLVAVVLMAGGVAAAPSASSATTANDPDASIPFADHGGIRDWRAHDDRSMYVQGANGQWYYAEMFGTCFGLDFADSIGFVVEPYGRFDRYSSVIVDGHKCMIASLHESAPPSPREKLRPPDASG